MFITFANLKGISSWGVVRAFLLVLVGFFPLAVLLGAGALWLLTVWRTTR